MFRNLLVKALFFSLILLFSHKSSLATNPPTLLNPSDNSTITDTSPKLSWSFSGQCYTGGSCFYAQVASSGALLSADKYYKDYYTPNTYWTPRSLALQKWFWRVKAKDSTKTWSGWSTIWSFTIVSSPSPTPTPASSPTPIPSNSSSPSSSPPPSSIDTVVLDTISSDSTPVPNPTSLSVNLFDNLKATISSKSVLPVSTKASSLNSSIPGSKQEKFLADKEINIPKILMGFGFIILISSAGLFIKSLKK